MKYKQYTIKNILTRYTSMIMLNIFFLTSIFTNIMAYIFTQITHILFSIAIPTTTSSNNIISIENFSISIVSSCIAASAYIIMTFIFLSINQKPKTILKNILLGYLLFSIANLIRIWLLIIILLKFGVSTFYKYHLVFYEAISGIIVGIIIIYLLKTSKNTSIPIIDDIKTIIKLKKH